MIDKLIILEITNKRKNHVSERFKQSPIDPLWHHVEIWERERREERIHESLRGSSLWPTSTGQEPKGLHFLIHFFDNTLQWKPYL